MDSADDPNSTQPDIGATGLTSPAPALNPSALSIDEMSRLLSAVGKKVTVEQIQADIEAGAPCSPDGRINLVHYAAWLLQRLAG
jgi:hypothetical protein